MSEIRRSGPRPRSMPTAVAPSQMRGPINPSPNFDYSKHHPEFPPRHQNRGVEAMPPESPHTPATPPMNTLQERSAFLYSLDELSKGQSYICHATLRGTSLNTQYGMVTFDNRGIAILDSDLAYNVATLSPPTMTVLAGTKEDTAPPSSAFQEHSVDAVSSAPEEKVETAAPKVSSDNEELLIRTLRGDLDKANAAIDSYVSALSKAEAERNTALANQQYMDAVLGWVHNQFGALRTFDVPTEETYKSDPSKAFPEIVSGVEVLNQMLFNGANREYAPLLGDVLNSLVEKNVQQAVYFLWRFGDLGELPPELADYEDENDIIDLTTD